MEQGFCRFPCLSFAEVERRQAELHGVDTPPSFRWRFRLA